MVNKLDADDMKAYLSVSPATATKKFILADGDTNGFINFYITFKLTARNPTPPKQVIVIHPSDLSRIYLNVSAGSAEFDLPDYVTVNAQGGISFLGVPVMDSVAQTLGRFNILDTHQMVMGIRENFRIECLNKMGTM
jgi:hypothetical protein